MLLALMAGVAVAVQAELLGQAQRTLGPVLTAGISGLATGMVGIAAALLFARPESFGARPVGFALVTGLLGAFIVGSIAYGTGQAGIARTLSLVIGAQLLVGFLLDSLGLFGGEASLSVPKALGVILILIGGILVVRA
jgi:transporter family-2 protein